MLTSSNGNIFRVTGHLCGEFTGHRWIPHTKASDAELSFFFDLRLNKQLSKQSCSWWFEMPSRALWHHCNAMLSFGWSFCRWLHQQWLKFSSGAASEENFLKMTIFLFILHWADPVAHMRTWGKKVPGTWINNYILQYMWGYDYSSMSIVLLLVHRSSNNINVNYWNEVTFSWNIHLCFTFHYFVIMILVCWDSQVTKQLVMQCAWPGLACVYLSVNSWIFSFCAVTYSTEKLPFRHTFA